MDHSQHHNNHDNKVSSKSMDHSQMNHDMSHMSHEDHEAAMTDPKMAAFCLGLFFRTLDQIPRHACPAHSFWSSNKVQSSQHNDRHVR